MMVLTALMTPSVEAEVFPVPPLREEMVTLFVFVPVVVPVTVTVTVQMLFIAIVAPLRLMSEPLTAAVTVPPAQVVEALGTAAFCNPAGYVSVKPIPVNATGFPTGLVIVKVIVVDPFKTTAEVPKVLAMDGGAITATVFKSVLLPSLISSTLSFGSTVAVFAKLPEEVDVTGKAILKDAPTGSVTVPFASQLRKTPVMEQLIVPVGGVVPFVTVRTP